ncbi:hypothetical protein OOK41_11810 [Micromonospora sp. NBC_01655]|uniref:hypothetical protein n=1 Tax=unclassified Micromonospora TaxID=2617518 RepID=UPI000E4507FA|nr:MULTISPECIES: hypothetical protein [unclassified Micromonospora]MCX4470986.1 hypothetical protein [Micromonospora sp. NBC_01655]
MAGNDTYTGAVANARRTRLGAGWVAADTTEAREYSVTDGPVANARRSRAEEDPAGGGES